MMITILLLFASCFTYGQSTKCQICIIDSTCTDDYIHFNVSISKECEHPIETYFSYDTDIDSDKHYLNKTIGCRHCYFDFTIESIHDAWDYILKLESPETTKSCSIRKARCGGYTSRYIWIGTASLSGLFIIFGVVLGIIRYCRTRKPPMKAIQ
ncbi:unnamed protein product [Rotaria sp. Silwood1]|nr:unnamed protein product [Rotaria sp. Silwood1]CAF3378236.1 unnamed protein product [Rotaria sp. Silwood1]CAF4583702.1 unnamed protein product [Rotaria sp. Silwood1]CAF4615947.1 unnamed protein product [Rotaria sp. Silwood1]CAF4899401.1 unnamed protein product [Rotaria sp. Silwood1]